MMTRSIEVRWFVRGDLELELARWFGGGALPAWSDEGVRRSDEYLLIPGHDEVGYRIPGPVPEGRRRAAPEPFEFQERRAWLGPVRVGVGAGGVVGHLEEWLRWSSEESRPEDWNALPADSARRVPITRRRARRWYGVGGVNGPFVPLEAGDDAPRRAVAELELVTVDTRRGPVPCWSLGVAAVGDVEDELLMSTARGFARDFLAGCPRRLHLADSYSYPAWLGRLANA